MAANPSADEAQVRDLDRAWNKAYQDKDASALANVLANDWLGLTPEHDSVTRKQLLEDQQNVPPDAQVSFQNGSLHLLGDVAVTTGETKVEAEDTYIHQRFTRVYAKRNGQWQAVAVQVIPIPLI